MTGRSVSYPTVSAFQKGYKRSTTKLYRTYTRRVLEYGWADKIPDEEISPDPSGRENLIPLDYAPGYGAAMIGDGGNESRTDSPDLIEGSFVYNHCNSRFAITLRAQALDRKGRAAQIIRQIKHRSLKCVEAVMRKYGYMFYGTTTGIVALVSGNPNSATTHTLTLKDAFGIAELDNPAYLAGMFPIGEGVCLIRSGSLVAGAYGQITGYSLTAGTIDVDWGTYNGSVSVDPADGDGLVFFNAVNDATIDASDYNRWNVGVLDGLATDSVHGVSKTTYPTTGPALYDTTTGGGFGFVKVKKMKQALENLGDTTLRRVIMANGVENDMQARERGAIVWSNSGAMNLDADVTARGIKFETSRFTPPTCALGMGADAFGKSVLTDRVDEEEMIDFGDARLHKAEDKSAVKGGVDIISANIIRSRSRLAAYIALDEQ